MKKKITLFVLSLMMTAAFTTAADVDVVDNISSDVTWTSDNVYYLDGFIFVEDGATLTIEPGTIIKGYLGTGESASALIIKRGGKIMAEGTAEAPIIFTASDDDNLDQGTDVKGSWGGLIILGKGTHNNLTNDNGIEGVPEEAGALYGGDLEDDNSGVLKYVSIRHGGSELAPDEEINGLTLGAVGSGTTIDFVEIMGNDDDGIEWFGGSVNIKHAIVSDCADDSYDIDEGFHGMVQFAYTEQSADGTGDNFGEHDGGPSSNRWGTPNATPVFSNVTYIGSGPDAGNRALTLREYWGGEYHNSVFAEQQKGIRVEYVEDFADGAMGGSFTQWNKGALKIENNVFQNVAGGTADGIFSVYSPEDELAQPIYTIPQDSADAFVAYFAEAGNSVNDAMGVSQSNPVPADSLDVKGASFEGLDSFFDEVIFKGAFNPCLTDGHWAGSWSFTFADDTYDASIAGTCYDAQVDFVAVNSQKTNVKVFPNPATEFATVTFDNASQEAVNINVYNLSGQVVLSASTMYTEVNLDVTELRAGMYTISVSNSQEVLSTGQLIVK
ncbi:MAG: T9SS type A sorting domain-containing protein [Bacteroidales bacterium]|nr:T9SS type A sorting domain-containing protein [Bacteroidales bacterium]